MSPRLLFSITIVNTVPPFHGGAAEAGALASGSQGASVLPDVFAQPPARIKPRTAREMIDMLGKVVLESAVDKRNVCGLVRPLRRTCAPKAAAVGFLP